MLDSSMSRRNVLRTAVVTAAAASGAGLLASPADAAPGPPLPYPDIVDTTHASKEVARIMRGFFTAKSRHDPDELMTYFDKQDAFYIGHVHRPDLSHRLPRRCRRHGPAVIRAATRLQDAFAAGDVAAATALFMRRGNTAIELDPTGKITRLTAVYDAGLLTYPAYQSLVLASAEAPL